MRKFIFTNLQMMVEDWKELTDKDIEVYLKNLLECVTVLDIDRIIEKEIK